MQLGLPRTTVLYNRNAAPILQFQSSLFEPNEMLLKAESIHLQRLPAAPRWSFSNEILWNLKSLGFNFQFCSILRSSLAARARIAAKSKVFDQLISSLDDCLNGFDGPVCLENAKRVDSSFVSLSENWKSRWLYHSSVYQILQAFKWCNKLCGEIPCGNSHLQAWICKILMKTQGRGNCSQGCQY